MQEELDALEQHVVPDGRIDMHNHSLPGVDDGCRTVEESVIQIQELMQHGYVGAICTPHIWPEMFPGNSKEHIQIWTDALRDELSQRDIAFELWTGGEIRLHKKVIDEWKADGVITLADSNYVLVDFWEAKWPRWVNKAFEWLLTEGYTPILAHPERLGDYKKLDQQLEVWMTQGVLLQGNFKCFTGEEGYLADVRIRKWMEEGWYTFLAMDAHAPDSMMGRIDGFDIAIATYTQSVIDELTMVRPREMILGLEMKAK
ncbi:tyrosine-protein phosphatase [Poriferisphaera sp. WC338]|uniref:tyrosine-protein phosphatase n=1 Tax=Poriferisphaera sp. WC338 TaxID=3425129 RepID=UPI003D817301